jgi:hypothetical protein
MLRGIRGNGVDREVLQMYAGVKLSEGKRMTVVPKLDVSFGPLGEVVRLRVDEEMKGRVEAVIKETGREQSDVLRRLLLAGLKLHEKKKVSKK